MRKAEIEAVESLLQEPAEDSIELASRIIKALDAVRAESNTPYYVVTRVSLGSVVESVGPFAGAQAANRAVQSGKLGTVATKAVISPLYGMKRYEELLRELDER